MRARSVLRWNASTRTLSITTTKTRLFGKVSLHFWSNRGTNQSVTWMRLARSSRVQSSSCKKCNLTARVKLICHTLRLWTRCKRNSTRDWRKLKRHTKTPTTNSNKKCGSWKERKRKLLKDLSLLAATKCLKPVISAKNLKSCKIKLRGLVRSSTLSSASVIKRFRSTNKNLKRSAKFSTKRNESSTKRVPRPNQNRPNYFWITNVSVQSGTNSSLT